MTYRDDDTPSYIMMKCNPCLVWGCTMIWDHDISRRHYMSYCISTRLAQNTREKSKTGKQNKMPWQLSMASHHVQSPKPNTMLNTSTRFWTTEHRWGTTLSGRNLDTFWDLTHVGICQDVCPVNFCHPPSSFHPSMADRWTSEPELSSSR